MSDAFVSALREVVDDRQEPDNRLRVLTGAADTGRHLVSERGAFTGSALAVVQPRSTAAVAAVVELCHRHQIVVVPQGGNTGLAGGATPVGDRPAIVVSMERMNRIEAVEVERSTMMVEAGVTIEAMQDAAAKHGLLFAPDWGARGTATIGGGIATNAGGNNVLRYGSMRQQILGLEVVLASGEVWNGLRALHKDATGYDLKQLFIGAEGTLGLVTRAVVRLHAGAPFANSALVALTSLADAPALARLATEEAPDLVTAVELIPRSALERACQRLEVAVPIPLDTEFFVLIKLTAGVPVRSALAQLIATAQTRGHVVDAVVAATADQESRLWNIRDELSPQRLYPDTHEFGLKYDAAVPLDRIVELYETVTLLASQVTPGALVYGFGHVGDGNLHMMVLPDRPDSAAGFIARRPELQDQLDAAILGLGGTLSAEHGIGRLLQRRSQAQKPAIEWTMMRTIKRALDPDGLMNPGVLFGE